MTMTTTTQTFDILGREFEMDELADIVNHGMAGGVSGFIYSTELAVKFDENEDDILNFLDEYAFDLGEGTGMKMIVSAIEANGQEWETMQQLKEMAVWMAVELQAMQILQRNGHPDFC